MKKLLSVILGSLLVSMMFVTPGSLVKAAGTNSNEIQKTTSAAALTFSADEEVNSNSDCGCNVTTLTGAERNKVVSNLISSDGFMTYKKLAMQSGYNWDGAGAIEVERNDSLGGAILEAVHFSNKDGKLTIIFIEGNYVGSYLE